MVKLRVTDNDGATATHSVNVVAGNTLPFASLTASPNPVAAGAPVLLDARGSSDSDGTIVKYDWDLDGNGSFETTTGATATRSHTYPNAATFNVGVKVTDNDGGTRTASRPLVVTGDPSGGRPAPGTDRAARPLGPAPEPARPAGLARAPAPAVTPGRASPGASPAARFSGCAACSCGASPWAASPTAVSHASCAPSCARPTPAASGSARGRAGQSRWAACASSRRASGAAQLT